MKVLEIRISVPDDTLDDDLCQVAKTIREEIGATGLDVDQVAYSIKSESQAANFVM